MLKYYLKCLVVAILVGFTRAYYAIDLNLIELFLVSVALATTVYIQNFHWDEVKTYINEWAKL